MLLRIVLREQRKAVLTGGLVIHLQCLCDVLYCGQQVLQVLEALIERLLSQQIDELEEGQFKCIGGFILASGDFLKLSY